MLMCGLHIWICHQGEAGSEGCGEHTAVESTHFNGQTEAPASGAHSAALCIMSWILHLARHCQAVLVFAGLTWSTSLWSITGVGRRHGSKVMRWQHTGLPHMLVCQGCDLHLSGLATRLLTEAAQAS